MQDFDLRANRNPSSTKRKNERRICSQCGKSEMRIRNHLRQTHHVKLCDLQEAVDSCLPILQFDSDEESMKEADETDSEDDRRDRKVRMERHFMEDISYRENAMAQPESDDEDFDWLGNQYFGDKDKTALIIPKGNGELQIEKDVSDESNSEAGDVEQSDTSGDEDDEEAFHMSSIDEDNLLKDFTQWLSSMDGGSKNPEQSKKHKNTLQSIVRFNGELLLYILYIS